MNEKLDATQIKVARQILQKRLAEFPVKLVLPMLEFTDALLRCENEVSRKFIVADIDFLIQQNDDPELMATIAAQYLHTVEEIRTVLEQGRVDSGGQPPQRHATQIITNQHENLEDSTGQE